LRTNFTDGLHYQDIDLVLQRVPSSEWTLIYNLSQRWVKNNHDPEDIVLNSAGKEHKTLIYNDTAFLLAMAITDGALFRYKTLDNLQKQEIPMDESEAPLQFNISTLNQPIQRKSSKAKGDMDEPMPRSTFTNVFSSTLKKAGYLCATSIYVICRQMGRRVNKLYTEGKRPQHFAQGDPHIFEQSYTAKTLSIKGQAAFLSEKADRSNICYFQGLESSLSQPPLNTKLTGVHGNNAPYNRSRWLCVFNLRAKDSLTRNLPPGFCLPT
jgi:Protein of unknown function (DUF3435)